MSGLPSPYAATLGLSVGESGGRAVVTMASTPRTAGRPGFLHGGAIAALLDQAGLVAVDGAIEREAKVTPVTIAQA